MDYEEDGGTVSEFEEDFVQQSCKEK